jgi:hypothetical protein
MSRRVRPGESAEFRVVMRFPALSWLVLRLVRQAGGHWFKPSTAHENPRICGGFYLQVLDQSLHRSSSAQYDDILARRAQ